VGRHLNIKISLFGAIVMLGASTAAPAQTEVIAAQIYPTIPLNTPLARDAETFEIDKSLDAQCRKMGKPSSVCLCVTHVMKYELTLREYRVATRLYGQTEQRFALQQSLRREGYTASEIEMVEEMERSLTEDDDFDERCSDAKSYYKNGDYRKSDE